MMLTCNQKPILKQEGSAGLFSEVKTPESFRISENMYMWFILVSSLHIGTKWWEDKVEFLVDGHVPTSLLSNILLGLFISFYH